MLRTRKLVLVVSLVAVFGVPTFMLAKEKKPKAAGNSMLDLQAVVTKIEDNKVTVTLQLPIAANTTFTVDGAAKAITDLKAGQHLTLTFKGDDLATVVATSAGDAPASSPQK